MVYLAFHGIIGYQSAEVDCQRPQATFQLSCPTAGKGIVQAVEEGEVHPIRSTFFL